MMPKSFHKWAVLGLLVVGVVILCFLFLGRESEPVLHFETVGQRLAGGVSSPELQNRLLKVDGAIDVGLDKSKGLNLFDIIDDESGLNHKCLRVESDKINMSSVSFLISEANFDTSQVSNDKFYRQVKSSRAEWSYSDVCNPYNVTDGNETITFNNCTLTKQKIIVPFLEWEEIGKDFELKEKNASSIGYALSPSGVIKWCFELPITRTKAGFGNKGTIYATINDNLTFVDKQNSSWWNLTWHKRQDIGIVEVDGVVLSNYSHYFSNWDTEGLINSSNMKSDCSDVIITDKFNREVDFNITGCNTTNSTVYFRLDVGASSTTNYTVYYNNPDYVSNPYMKTLSSVRNMMADAKATNLYYLNEGAGSVIEDMIGNVNGSLSNVSSWNGTACMLEGEWCTQFDGNSQIGFLDNFDTIANYTIEIWMGVRFDRIGATDSDFRWGKANQIVGMEWNSGINSSGAPYIGHKDSTNSWKNALPNARSPVNWYAGQWYHIAMVVDDTANTIGLYQDGLLIGNFSGAFSGFNDDVSQFYLARYSTEGTRAGNLMIAGFRYSPRVRTSLELNHSALLYAPSISLGSVEAATLPPGIMNPVVNNSVVYNTTWINVSAVYTDGNADQGIVYFNLSVGGSYVADYTTPLVDNGSLVSWVVDPNNWSIGDVVQVYVVGRDNNSNLGSSNYTQFTVQNHIPTIPYQVIPLNGSKTANLTVSFNCTNSTDADGGVMTYVFANQSATMGNSTGTFDYTFDSNTTIYWHCWADDTFGGKSPMTGNRTFLIDTAVIYNVSSSISSPIEGLKGDWEFTVNYSNLTVTSLTANGTYNGTAITFNSTHNPNNSTYLFSGHFTAPIVSGNTLFNLTLYIYNNGGVVYAANYSQLVLDIPNLSVSSAPCNDTTLAFYIRNEANFSLLNGSIEYNFKVGLSNSSLINVFGQITSPKLFVCANFTYSPYWVLGSGEIFYTSTDYVDRRYYLFTDTTLTNVTQNFTLYSLPDSEQTSFQLEVEDTSLSPYTDKFTTLLRWYPNLNEYRVVEMGKTDEKGETIMHVKTEDVDYRIGVYEKNGTLIKLAKPIRMICSVAPCIYTLTIAPTDQDFTSFLNVDYSFVYNYSTSIWTFTFTDTTQETQSMNLTVYKDTSTSSYSICSSLASGWTGAITCNTSGYTGTLRGVITRSASPSIPLASKIISSYDTLQFKSGFILWLNFFIALPVIGLLTLISPTAAIIGGVLAFIPAWIFKAISWAVIGSVALMGGIVLHFVRRARGGRY